MRFYATSDRRGDDLPGEALEITEAFLFSEKQTANQAPNA
jgi:hypothetical protein